MARKESMKFNVQNLWLKVNQPSDGFGFCLFSIIVNANGCGIFFFNFIIDIIWGQEVKL